MCRCAAAQRLALGKVETKLVEQGICQFLDLADERRPLPSTSMARKTQTPGTLLDERELRVRDTFRFNSADERERLPAFLNLQMCQLAPRSEYLLEVPDGLR